MQGLQHFLAITIPPPPRLPLKIARDIQSSSVNGNFTRIDIIAIEMKIAGEYLSYVYGNGMRMSNDKNRDCNGAVFARRLWYRLLL